MPNLQGTTYKVLFTIALVYTSPDKLHELHVHVNYCYLHITHVYHDSLANVSRQLATTEALVVLASSPGPSPPSPGGEGPGDEAIVVLATIHPRVYGKTKGCARVYGE